MNQRFSLIALKFGRVIRVPSEVALLQNWPIDLVQIVECLVEICPLVISMTIGKKIAQTRFCYMMQAGNENDNLLIGPPCYASPTGVNVA